MHNKKLGLILTLGLAAGLVTGCGSDNNSKADNTAVEDNSKVESKTEVNTAEESNAKVDATEENNTDSSEEPTEENNTDVNTAEVAYDFADTCEKYLTYIGENLKNRDLIPTGTEPAEDSAHDATHEWLVNELKNAGYSEEQITEQPFTRKGFDDVEYSGSNVILSIAGKSSEKTVVIGTHFDGDGCGDNGSGVALLLGNAVNYVGMTPDYDVKLIFFDGEELGELGAYTYVESLSKEELANIAYMVNIDSVAFGDYCNIYGGYQNNDTNTIEKTEVYELAVNKAKSLGMKVYTTEDLDGYYAKNGSGPAIEENTLYSNPWTYENPAPANANVMSPSTGYWGDHAPFEDLEVPYLYLEATNWYAEGNDEYCAFTGYFETDDKTLGDGGMFMNTPYDTLENLTTIFPGRSLAHYHVFSPLLSSLILTPDAQ